MLSFRSCSAAKMPDCSRSTLRALAHLTVSPTPEVVSARDVLGHVRTGTALAAERIKHVFVLMLENRSFDHIFGFSALHGLDPRTGIFRDANGVTSKVSNSAVAPNGANLSVRAQANAVYQLAGEHEDPAHEFKDVLKQLCGNAASGALVRGKLASGTYPTPDMSGFVQAFIDGEVRADLSMPENLAGASVPMRSFSPSKLPALNTLATNFAVCDRWHASMPGPTMPNRLFAHAASSADYDDSPSGMIAAGIGISEGVYMRNGTIYHRLEGANLQWRIYSDDSPFMSTTSFLEGVWAADIRALSDLEEDLEDDDFNASYIFIEPNYAVLSNSPGPYGGTGNSMHPVGDARLADDLVASVYKTLRGSRRWEASVLLVVFDEHGGFYDHVEPPACVPPGDSSPTTASNNKCGFKFDRLGPRVPALVISPYVPSGLLDSALYEHSSIPAAVERRFGLAPMTARDAAATDFWNLLTLEVPREDSPTAFAGHPPEADLDSSRSALTDKSARAIIGAKGVLPMIAGAQLQELKRRTPPYEYEEWKARFTHSVTEQDLERTLRQAHGRLEQVLPTWRGSDDRIQIERDH